MNMDAWTWAQWLVAIWWALELAATGVMHGKQYSHTPNIGTKIAAIGIMALILGAGGFWA